MGTQVWMVNPATQARVPDGVFRCKSGDTATVLRAVLLNNYGVPVDLSLSSGTFNMSNVRTGASKVSASALLLVNPIFSGNSSTDVLTSNGHGLRNGDVVAVKSTSALPAGLLPATRYYVRDATANTLKLSETKDGAAVDLTDTGTGTHSLVLGVATYTFSSANLDTPGDYRAEFAITTFGAVLTYPNNGYIAVQVLSDLD